MEKDNERNRISRLVVVQDCNTPFYINVDLYKNREL